MGAITMKDVATSLGVSVTSVSNAFNRPDRISTTLRESIIAGAEQLGYFGPDAAGRALRSGKTDSIGVIFGPQLSYAFTDPYAVELLANVAAVLERAGKSITLLAIPEELGDEVASVRTAIVDGIIGLCAGAEHPAVVAARRRGLPIVLTESGPDRDFVAIDDTLAGSLAGRHLRELGHRRVAVLTGWMGSRDDPHALDPADPGQWGDSSRRVGGILSGLSGLDESRGSQGSAGSEVAVLSAGRNTRAHGRRAAALLLDSETPPTAIVGVSDVLALGVVDELIARGLAPGADVSVIGFDGIAEGETVGLTSVVQPTAEVGRRAAELLLSPQEGPRQVILPVELRPGRTTARPARPVSA